VRRKWEEWLLFIAFPLLPLSLTFLSIFVPFLYFLFQPYPSLSFECQPTTAQTQLFYIYYLAYFGSLVLKILYFHYTYFHFLVKVGESLKIVLENFVFAKCSVRFF
jgi:hypothetical protein